jgi:hypothetical protein
VITGDEFARAVRAKRCLFAMPGIDEKFVMTLAIGDPRRGV